MPKKNIETLNLEKIQITPKRPRLPKITKQPEPLLGNLGRAQERLNILKTKYLEATNKEAETQERKGIANVIKETPVKSAWNQPIWMTPFTILNRPLQAILHFANAIRLGKNPLVGFVLGLVGGLEDVDATKALGIDTTQYSGAGKFFSNVGLSIVLDPLTYLTLGSSAVLKLSKVPKLIKTATALKSVMTAKNLGKVGNLSKTILKTAKQYGGVNKFASLGKKIGVTSASSIQKIKGRLAAERIIQISPNLYKTAMKVRKAEWQFVKSAFGIPIIKRVGKGVGKLGGKLLNSRSSVSAVNSFLKFTQNRVAGMQIGLRKIASKFQFGYKLDPIAKEQFSSLLKFKEEFGRTMVQYGKILDEKLITPLSQVYYALLQGKKVGDDLLKQLGTKLSIVKKDIKFYGKALSSKSTLEEIYQVISQSTFANIGVRKQQAMKAFEITSSLHAMGGVTVANPEQAKVITEWLNKGKFSPLILANTEDLKYIAVIDDIPNITDDLIKMRQTQKKLITETEAKEFLTNFLKKRNATQEMIDKIVLNQQIVKGKYLTQTELQKIAKQIYKEMGEPLRTGKRVRIIEQDWKQINQQLEKVKTKYFGKANYDEKVKMYTEYAKDRFSKNLIGVDYDNNAPQIFNVWENKLQEGIIDLSEDNQFLQMLNQATLSKKETLKILEKQKANHLKYLDQTADQIFSSPEFAPLLESAVGGSQTWLRAYSTQNVKNLEILSSKLQTKINKINDLVLTSFSQPTPVYNEIYEIVRSFDNDIKKLLQPVLDKEILGEMIPQSTLKTYFTSDLQSQIGLYFNNQIGYTGFKYSPTNTLTDLARSKIQQQTKTKTFLDLIWNSASQSAKTILDLKNPTLSKELLKLTKTKGGLSALKVAQRTYKNIFSKAIAEVKRLKLTPSQARRLLAQKIAKKVQILPKSVKDRFWRAVKNDFDEVKTVLKTLDNEIKKIKLAQSKIVSFVGEGVDLTDIRKVLTNRFIKEFQTQGGKFEKKTIELALQSFKKSLPENVYNQLFYNVSRTEQTAVFEKLTQLITDQKKLNQTLFANITSKANVDLMKSFTRLMPKETTFGVNWANLSKIKTLEKVTDFVENSQKTFMKTLSQFTSIPEYWQGAHYMPLIMNTEYGEQLAVLAQVAKKQKLMKNFENWNLWLPTLSNIQLDPYKLNKAYMTMRRSYLDNGEFLNSILGTSDLFNNESASLFSQVYQNLDNFYTAPSIATYAIENKMIKILDTSDALRLRLGDITKDGYRVISKNQATKIFNQVMISLGDAGEGVIVKFKKDFIESGNFKFLRTNYALLQKEIQKLDPKIIYQQLLKKQSVKNAKKFHKWIMDLPKYNLVGDRITQDIGKGIWAIKNDLSFAKSLDAWEWLRMVQTKRYSKQTILNQKQLFQDLPQQKVLLHNSIYDAAENIFFRDPEKSSRSIYNMVSKIFGTATGLWKGAVLLRNFAGYHLRNILGNANNAIVGGVSPVFYSKQMIKNLRKMWKYRVMTKTLFSEANLINYMNVNSIEEFNKLAIKLLKKTKKYSQQDITDFFDIFRLKQVGVMGNSRVKTETYVLLNKLEESLDMNVILGGQKTKARKISNTIIKAWEGNANLNMFMDDVHRLTIHQYFADNPFRIKELGYLNADQASRFIGFDFHQLTGFEKKYLQRLFPFYTWFRKNFQFHLQNFGKNTPRYRYILRALKNWNSDLGDATPQQILDWQKERNYLINPFNKNQLLKTEIPFLNYDEILGGRVFGANILSRINPFMRILIEAVTGRNFFYDRSIDANEINQHIIDSMFQVSTARKRWGAFFKLLSGKVDKEAGILVDLAPSFFGKINREQNQLKNKWAEVIRLQDQLKNLKTKGTYVPRIRDLRKTQFYTG